MKKEEDTLPNIDITWSSIKKSEGETFTQIRGGLFTYKVNGNYIVPDRTNVQISKSHIQRALEHYPLQNTVKIQDLRGPSYIYAVLMDERIYTGN